MELPQLSTHSLKQALKKLNSEVDPETKNLIINGDRPHLALTLRQLRQLDSHKGQELEDSLDNNEAPNRGPEEGAEMERSRESLTLSRSEDAGNQLMGLKKKEKKLGEQFDKTKDRSPSDVGVR